MKKTLLIGLLLISTLTYSQVEKGDISLTFAASYSSISGTSFGLINAKLGRYFTQNIEAGIRPQIMIGEGFTMYGTGVYGTYNFLTADAKLLPYVGADLSFLQTETDLVGFSRTDIGAYGGAKYFLTEALNLDAGIVLSTQIAGDETGADGGTFLRNLGIGFIFGKLK